MDAILRRLKKKAQSDPSCWPAYARALERALGGIKSFEQLHTTDFSHFRESSVADVDYTREYGDDPVNVGGHEICLNGDGKVIGWLVDTDWKNPWIEEDAAEIEASLSEEFKGLMTYAKDGGYDYVLLWRG